MPRRDSSSRPGRRGSSRTEGGKSFGGKKSSARKSTGKPRDERGGKPFSSEGKRPFSPGGRPAPRKRTDSQGSSSRGERGNFSKGFSARRKFDSEGAGDERKKFSPRSGSPSSRRPPRREDSAGPERRGTRDNFSKGFSPRKKFGGDGTGDERKKFSPRSGSPSSRRPPRRGDSEGTERRGTRGNFSKGFPPRKKFEGDGTGDERKKFSPRSGSPSSRRPPRREDSARPERRNFSKDAPSRGKFNKGDGDQDDSKKSLAREPFESPKNKRSYKGNRRQDPDKTAQSFEAPAQAEKIRLNKYIANSGVCSRREADELISMGLISVNGTTITELGYKVNPGDEVRYENKVLRAERNVYILMNKPKGYLTTTEDPQERNTVMHIIGSAVRERIYPVGRLDRNTTGLLLLTNDGDLADKLMHPSYNVKKIYKVDLDRPLSANDFQAIRDGVHLEEGKAVVDDLAIVSDDGKTVGLEIHIGWNRVVRRIFESLNYQVIKLDRSVYAGLDKKDLPRGRWRFLTREEVVHLKHFK